MREGCSRRAVLGSKMRGGRSSEDSMEKAILGEAVVGKAVCAKQDEGNQDAGKQ